MFTVLVVDDDPKFSRGLEEMLAAAGYRVLCASTGKEAVDLLERVHNEIDLTIVDLALPDINGFEIIGALSRRPNPMKIIATTALYKDFHLEMAETLGAQAAIRKPSPGSPIPAGEWLRTVHQLIGDPAGAGRASAASVPSSDVAESSNGKKANR